MSPESATFLKAFCWLTPPLWRRAPKPSGPVPSAVIGLAMDAVPVTGLAVAGALAISSAPPFAMETGPMPSEPFCPE